MPTELLGSLPQLTAIVEKLGVVGILIVAVVWLIYERMRLMKLSARTFRERDLARQIQERYRASIIAEGHALPDVSDLLTLYKEEGVP